MGYSLAFKRRFPFLDSENIISYIKYAIDHLNQDEYVDFDTYADKVFTWVLFEFQDRYGEDDDFWYVNEDEVLNYLKSEYMSYV
jgi:hypothetical protein